MGRFLAIAALVLLVFVCVVLARRLSGGDRETRERRFAQEQYVRYVRKAQRAAKRNRAEAELYTSIAEDFRRKALGESGESRRDE